MKTVLKEVSAVRLLFHSLRVSLAYTTLPDRWLMLPAFGVICRELLEIAEPALKLKSSLLLALKLG